MIRTRTFALSLAVASITAATHTVWSQGDPVFADGYPRIWSWTPVLGEAFDDLRFARCVTINNWYNPCLSCNAPHVCGTPCSPSWDRGGADTADIVCNEIVNRGTIEGRNGIILLGVGGGNYPGVTAPDFPALFFHEDDAISFSHGDPATNYVFRTPWMSNGIAETEAWMNEFIHQYKWRQLFDNIPDPDRLIFDTEVTAADADAYNSGQPTMIFDLPVALSYFSALQNEPPPGPCDPGVLCCNRWCTEQVSGFPAGTTMEALWVDAQANGIVLPSPASDPDIYWGSLDNLRWYTWWYNLLLQAQEGAMNEAFYNDIRIAWPDCMSSDYDATKFLDGEPSDTHRNSWIRGDYSGSVQLRLWWMGTGDLQAPVLYPDGSSYFFDEPVEDEGLTDDSCTALAWTPHEPPAEVGLRLARFNIDSCAASFNGQYKWLISPWVTLPHERVPTYYATAVGGIHAGLKDRRTSNDENRRLLALAKSRGAQELIVWHHTNFEYSPPLDSNGVHTQYPYNWSRMQKLIDQVWKLNVRSSMVYAGNGLSFPPPPAPHPLQYAHNDELTVTSANGSGAGVQVTFDNDFDQTPYLRVNIEVTSAQASTVQAYIRTTAGTDVPIDLDLVNAGASMPACANQRVRLSGRVATSPNFYGTNNLVNVRVFVAPGSGTFDVKFDLVQLLADDDEHRMLADFNGNGVVDVADKNDLNQIVDYVLQYGGYYPEGDFNYDNVCNAADKTAFKVVWDNCIINDCVPAD